jgi:hypothetical protein
METRIMKPKQNKAGVVDSSQSFDCCQTPPYAIDPLIPYLSRDLVYWDPFGGRGSIVRTMRSLGYQMIGSDILPIV